MGKLKQKEDGLVSRIARAVAVVAIVVFLVNERTSVGHSKQILLDFEKADKQTVRLRVGVPRIAVVGSQRVRQARMYDSAGLGRSEAGECNQRFIPKGG